MTENVENSISIFFKTKFNPFQIWPLFNKCAIVAKKELELYSGPFGIGLKYCGTVFVNRASSEAGRKAVNEAGTKAKKSGTSLFLFPEG